MKRYILLTFSIIFYINLIGQDASFTQYALSGTAYNPAMVGVMETRHRVTALYRNQWYSVLTQDAYQQGLIAYEGMINCTDYGIWAMGIQGQSDFAGEVPINNNQLQVSLSYQHELGGGLALAGGFKAGVLNFRLETSKLQFDEQFLALGYDPSAPTFEDLDNWNTSQFKLDLGFGVAVFQRDGLFSAGFSLLHINQPFYSFFEAGDENKLGTGLIVHGSAKVMENLYLKGLFQRQAFFKNSRQWQLLLGVQTPFSLGLRTSDPYISFGFNGRFSGKDGGGLVLDALIPAVYYDMGSMGFSLSYDINTSPLAQATWLNGGLELGLTIKFGERSCLRCPKM